MNREQYRKAFDEIPFSADFSQRTAELLRRRAREMEKENKTVHFGRVKKTAVLTAAAVALLAVSVSAAVMWLSPAQVADHHDQPLLAEAFDGPDAIEINETVESGDFEISLLGLVSGENLDVRNQDLDAAHTYAVLALRRLDGTPLENETFDFIRYTMTPLVAGYAPTAVNNWTLDAGASGFAQDGVYYYLLDTASLEMFADHTVYMAFYEGGAPSNAIFTVAEDGSIAFCDDFTGVQALFTLPLDPARADPAAADAFAASTGLTGWSNERTGGEDYVIDEQDTEDGKVLTIRPAGEPEGNPAPATAEEFEAYMASETARLQALVEAGEFSRENLEKEMQEMEETLQGLRDGTLTVYLLEDGGVFTSTAPTEGTHYEITEDGVNTVIGG